MTLAELLASGRVANLDVLATVHESEITAGSGAGMRVIDVVVWDGISVRIYPDRGLDLGQAWYRSVPLAWMSPIGETAPLRYIEGTQWSSAFMGGLMTTCGLRNVGLPSEGHGLHGTYSHLPAHELATARSVTSTEVFVEVSGVVTDIASPGPLRHRRTIRVHAGSGHIEVTDTTENLGATVAAAPLLYHCNFGAPLWAPPATLDIPVVSSTARDPVAEAAVSSWRQPPPVEDVPERVLEHDLGDAASGSATITNTALGLTVTLQWERDSLPQLNQWLDPRPGMSVLGIEPANCSTRGRAYERTAGTLPLLEPGATRSTSLTFLAWPATSD